MFIRQPFDEFLDMSYERISENSVKVTLPIQPLFVNSVGVIHGGVIATLADVALCNTVAPDVDGKQKVVTVDLNVTFLKGAKSEFLTARAFAVKEGRNITHADCIIHDDQDHVVAKARAILFNQ
ncbi:PaaI family thioesterase [Planococcus liqunii]|uniref:Medium/long-chain acyl-CoA thioesterase YigI n=1 Tax=Planococcus liqunii TaxID=3058394 RepID=A0ABT8MV86_9BACL|nr:MULTISPECIES: PaaI family thioesterase [unclassified Planococcus (in: firmicutes)]MDN7228832.1 PaaI family thioesterase [Planococcus sp. N064]WKA51264.1 PaaI family thioesterase [Planococcus sp. N056]